MKRFGDENIGTFFFQKSSRISLFAVWMSQIPDDLSGANEIHKLVIFQVGSSPIGFENSEGFISQKSGGFISQNHQQKHQ